MMYVGVITPNPFPEGLLAHSIMSDDTTENSGIAGTWQSETAADSRKKKHALFTPDELDIYVNKITLEAFVFYGKPIEHNAIDHIVYDHDSYDVNVVFENGSKIDLGVKIQWLVRPYFSKIEEIKFVQSKDGEAVDGKIVPVQHVKGPAAKG